MIWTFDKHSKQKASLTLISYAILVLSLGYLLPEEYRDWLGRITILVTLLSRAPQIYTNFKNQHTGPLAIVTVFLSLGGAGARVLTSLSKWSQDPLTVLNFLLATGLNGILFLQILFYKKNTEEWLDKKKK